MSVGLLLKRDSSVRRREYVALLLLVEVKVNVMWLTRTIHLRYKTRSSWRLKLAGSTRHPRVIIIIVIIITSYDNSNATRRRHTTRNGNGPVPSPSSGVREWLIKWELSRMRR
jgi:hypothetical protein